MSFPQTRATRWSLQQGRRINEHALLAICAIVVPLLLIGSGLGSYGLLNNNEGMYAEIAREMAEGSSWIIPHLNGLPYIEKPPLVYWLTGIALTWLGEGELAVRVVPAVGGALALLASGWFAARITSRREAWLSVLVLGSMLGFVVMSRMVMLDLWLAATLTTALFLEHAWVCGRASPRAAIGAGVALAAAVLTKGWVAVALFAIVGLTYCFTLPRHARRSARARMCSPACWIPFAALALPWHIAASTELPQFGWFYFINEHVLRFLGLREPHDYYSGPLWYYLPRVWLALLPWSFLLAVKRRISREGESMDRTHRRFLWIAALVPLVFFSVSSAKANYYVVVCLPPLAILIASNIARLELQCQPRGLWRRAAAAAAMVCIGLLTAALNGILAPAAAALAVAAVIAAGIATWRFVRGGHWNLASIAVALMAAPPVAVAISELQVRERELSARPWMEQHDELADRNVWIFADFESFSSVPFYANRPVQIIDSRSNDLAFAQRHGFGPHLFVSSSQIPTDASGLVWYDRRRSADVIATALGPRLRPLGCAENQCVGALDLLPPSGR